LKVNSASSWFFVVRIYQQNIKFVKKKFHLAYMVHRILFPEY